MPPPLCHSRIRPRSRIVVASSTSRHANLVDQFRRAATYVDRIFKGARPAELPIEQPTKFAFIISLKTAKALGLTIPLSLLSQADLVIE